jgi:hypothetical protein
MVNAGDRKFQVWERNSLSIDIYSEAVFIQKLNYLHNNPMQPKWSLCEAASEYRFSSAAFYETGVDEFGFLTHYKG